MAIEVIKFKDKEFPILQSQGFAAQYAFPFAKKICKGNGYDIGYCKEEWMFPGAMGIDPAINPEYHATNLPALNVDYIFSSHCLEHTPNWVEVLEYWHSKLQYKGVLFLYLPHCDYQKYWAPWHNRKHIHHLTPALLKEYFQYNDHLWTNVTVTEGYDLNGSFYVIAEKK